MSRLGDLRALLTERWQIPLALVALIVAGLSMYKLKPQQPEIPFESLVADVLALAQAGRFHDATNATANLLEMEPPPSRTEQATLHNTLANIIHTQERLREVPILSNVDLLLHHHEQAHKTGHPADAHGALRAGEAHEWRGDVRTALRSYEAVLERAPEPLQRRLALHALVRLLEDLPEKSDARRDYIESLLLEEGVEPEFLWTTLRQAIGEALDRADLPRATDLLVRFASRLARSDLKGYEEFLWAWVLTESGDLTEASLRLEATEAWLLQHPRTDPALDRAGFLPALAAWLRGRLDLLEQRPQEALVHFQRAASLQSFGDVFGLSTEGIVRALAALERHATARTAVTTALESLVKDPASASLVRPRLRAALLELVEERHRDNDTENTVSYADLAMELTGQDPERRLSMYELLGREYQWAAEQTQPKSAARSMLHRGAANNYEAAARLATLQDQRFATLLWECARQFDAAGHPKEARRAFQNFVNSRDTDPRMPQAYLKLGQACVVLGDFAAAIDWYRQLVQRFPRLEEATFARLALADCYLALGSEHYVEAEQVLVDLIEIGTVSPQAAAYREGLYTLGDLYYQRGLYAQAISRIEEFLSFYPDDPQGIHLRFMLADSFRRSAYRLREEDQDGRARDESDRRFRQAAEMFREYWSRLDNAAVMQDDAAIIYERLALFYRGDCLFELGDAVALEEALATYRQAAARYQNEPATLTAQVQIANVQMRMGRIREAAAAIERARWQLGNISDEAFARHRDGSSREWWQQYLDGIAGATSFAGLAQGNP